MCDHSATDLYSRRPDWLSHWVYRVERHFYGSIYAVVSRFIRIGHHQRSYTSIVLSGGWPKCTGDWSHRPAVLHRLVKPFHTSPPPVLDQRRATAHSCFVSCILCGFQTMSTNKFEFIYNFRVCSNGWLDKIMLLWYSSWPIKTWPLELWLAPSRSLHKNHLTLDPTALEWWWLMFHLIYSSLVNDNLYAWINFKGKNLMTQMDYQ